MLVPCVTVLVTTSPHRRTASRISTSMAMRADSSALNALCGRSLASASSSAIAARTELGVQCLAVERPLRQSGSPGPWRDCAEGDPQVVDDTVGRHDRGGDRAGGERVRRSVPHLAIGRAPSQPRRRRQQDGSDQVAVRQRRVCRGVVAGQPVERLELQLARALVRLDDDLRVQGRQRDRQVGRMRRDAVVADPEDAEVTVDAFDGWDIRSPGRACCTAWSRPGSTGNVSAAAGFRRWSRGCAAGRRLRRAAPATRLGSPFGAVDRRRARCCAPRRRC